MSDSRHSRAATLSFLCSRARAPTEMSETRHWRCLPRQTGAAFASRRAPSTRISDKKPEKMLAEARREQYALSQGV
jgi:hypothetical protein